MNSALFGDNKEITGITTRRVLILGGGGMLGHKLVQVCSQCFETWATVRSSPSGSELSLHGSGKLLQNIDAEKLESVEKVMYELRPDTVVNCIGVVKQLPEGHDTQVSLRLNSLFPRKLAHLCGKNKIRMIHISTDCVFSGHKGRYTEQDLPDADDLYGQTKLLGEVGKAGCLTLRTSFIGRELRTSHGLLEWFLGNKGGRVKGFDRAIFSGLTTPALAGIIRNLIQDHPGLSGIYHLAAEPVSKYDLLHFLNEAFQTNVKIDAVSDPVIDRSLNSTLLFEKTGLTAPSWRTMIDGLVKDPTPYEEWRRA